MARSEKFYHITTEEAEKVVALALQEKGAGAEVSAHIVGRASPMLYESDKPLRTQVKTLEFDELTRRWSANLLFLSGEDVLSAMPVAGRYEEMIDLPVLRQQVRTGDVIAQEDIEWRKFAQDKLRKGTITKAEEMIGKSPRRVISPNRPVREEELAAPVVVKKKAAVRMSYRTDAITLETSGIALESGSIGDTIRVQNMDSKAVVYATVESENMVRVTGLGAAPQNHPRKDYYEKRQ